MYDLKAQNIKEILRLQLSLPNMCASLLDALVLLGNLGISMNFQNRWARVSVPRSSW